MHCHGLCSVSSNPEVSFCGDVFIKGEKGKCLIWVKEWCLRGNLITGKEYFIVNSRFPVLSEDKNENSLVRHCFLLMCVNVC